ncbi:substrate-binding domain-containing protein [Kitasatospora saccharophila]|uniref:substrate-binding domain-containing protein n=1 Tax=Kitasatospora saccharophila TaxID=407973 RepID=UPI00363A4C7E
MPAAETRSVLIPLIPPVSHPPVPRPPPGGNPRAPARPDLDGRPPRPRRPRPAAAPRPLRGRRRRRGRPPDPRGRRRRPGRARRRRARRAARRRTGGSPRPLWDSETVAAVAADAPPAALDTADDLRALLTAARAVAHSTGPSGTALRALVTRLGLDGRVRLLQAPPGTPAGRLLADGRADLAFQQHSELAGLPGVRILGPLPGDTAITSTFAAAVLSTAARPAAARDLLDLLASDAASATARAHGMRPRGPR